MKDMLLQEKYLSIGELNNFISDWKIKARVTKKHPIKAWKSSAKSGCLLNIELIDNSGKQIQATFFNDQAKLYDGILEENKVYTFANGKVT